MRNDLHKDLRADFILANPPFNMSDWGGENLKEDVRWKYGVPPSGNANFAWVQHFIHHLAPAGIAGFVLANGSLSSNQAGEGEIRRRIIQADLTTTPGVEGHEQRSRIELLFLPIVLCHISEWVELARPCEIFGENCTAQPISSGANGVGVVYEFEPMTAMEKVLYTVGSVSEDFANPLGGVIADSAGNLYGTTSVGGTHGMGTVFKLTKNK